VEVEQMKWTSLILEGKQEPEQAIFLKDFDLKGIQKDK